MPMLKPLRGTQLNRAHPLTRSLDLCWLFNEGAGDKVSDLSGNGSTGTLQGAPSWGTGRFGSTLYYNGSDECVQTSSPVIISPAISASLWFKADELPSARAEKGTLLVQRTTGSPYQSFRTLIRDTDDKILLLIYNSSGVNTVSISSDSAIQTEIWYNVVFILDSNYDACMYVNGVQQTGANNAGSFYSANDVLRLGSRTGTVDDFKGKIDLVTIFNRSLSSTEIRLLNREPFCMFERSKSVEWILSGPTLASLGGSVSAQSMASGTLRSISSVADSRRSWLNAALFNGMTYNSLKLGTPLSLGWFWMRTAGCSALYRGPNMVHIDFADILEVASLDAEFISPRGCVPHDSNSTYFYAIRRFNCCGYQEQTLAAATEVAFDEDGNLLKPQPNKIFAIKSEQTKERRILLTWFYCPLDQKSQPLCFNVYYDNGTRQIDYQTPLATMSYRGRRFYMHRSDTLEPGKYLFAVRAENADGLESNPARVAVDVCAESPAPTHILSVGCI